jgi:Aldo/keto reductase family
MFTASVTMRVSPALVPPWFFFRHCGVAGGLARSFGDLSSWDCADLWVEMIGKWFKKTGRRNEIFLCTKFANTLDGKFNVRGDPEYVKSACRDSLKRLDIDQIDLFYMHR